MPDLPPPVREVPTPKPADWLDSVADEVQDLRTNILFGVDAPEDSSFGPRASQEYLAGLAYLDLAHRMLKLAADTARKDG